MTDDNGLLGRPLNVDCCVNTYQRFLNDLFKALNNNSRMIRNFLLGMEKQLFPDQLLGEYPFALIRDIIIRVECRASRENGNQCGHEFGRILPFERADRNHVTLRQHLP